MFDLNFFRIVISNQHDKGCLLPLLKRKKALTLASGTIKVLGYVLKYTPLIRRKIRITFINDMATSSLKLY